ncbi:hypothetical protein TELCIR_04183 [Teladorsagia circumcincta]|uniref:Uncharacterized protein n=1 Tax=Teladorsagia circumcincta TaxID=45464 RepID=A0A2G9UUB3_TELCI|nr:hypothetical protein TELCIR_04183 [Teladorsagia circumcincta]
MGAGKTVSTLVGYKLAKDKYGKEPKPALQSQKDITTSERSMAKLFKEAERLKQVLSANLDYYAQVESVH